MTCSSKKESRSLVEVGGSVIENSRNNGVGAKKTKSRLRGRGTE